MKTQTASLPQSGFAATYKDIRYTSSVKMRPLWQTGAGSNLQCFWYRVGTLGTSAGVRTHCMYILLVRKDGVRPQQWPTSRLGYAWLGLWQVMQATSVSTRRFL